MQSEIWDDDALDRKKLGLAFNKLVGAEMGPLAACVSAPFGSGKSFFARRWSQELRACGYPVLYFDALEHDYSETAILSFVEALCEQAKEGLLGSHKFSEQAKSVAKSALPIAQRLALRTALRLITLGGNDEDIESASRIITGEFESEADDMISRIGSAKKEQKKLYDDFAELIRLLKNQSQGKDVIIIVDELDRCNPKFSIEFLESLKKYFLISGVKFFIFCDREILAAHANKLFGISSKGEGYVGKFFTHFFRIPDAERSKFAEYCLDRRQIDWKTICGPQPGNECQELAASTFRACADSCQLTLRQIEKIVQHFELLCLIDERISLKSIMQYIIICFLREDDEDRYRDLQTGKLSPENLEYIVSNSNDIRMKPALRSIGMNLEDLGRRNRPTREDELISTFTINLTNSGFSNDGRKRTQEFIDRVEFSADFLGAS